MPKSEHPEGDKFFTFNTKLGVGDLAKIMNGITPETPIGLSNYGASFILPQLDTVKSNTTIIDTIIANLNNGGKPLDIILKAIPTLPATPEVEEESADDQSAPETPLILPLPEGVHYVGAIGIEQLIPSEKNQVNTEGLGLMQKAIHYFVVDHENGEREYVGYVDYDLRGMRLNKLLYAIAPSKVFGVDTADIIMDWTDIMNDEARMRRHAGMGEGWDIFMRERAFLLERIKEGKDEATSPKRGVVPVIRWKVDQQGKRTWIFDHLEGEPYSTITKAYLGGAFARTEHSDASYLNPLVGLYTVAVLSPSIIKAWPSHRGYSDSATNSSQSMGPTQVVVLATVKKDEFLSSAFIANSEAIANAHLERNQSTE